MALVERNDFDPALIDDVIVGCVVIVGSTTAVFTVSVAVALVTLPAVLLTTTSYLVPLCAVVVAGVV